MGHAVRSIAVILAIALCLGATVDGDPAAVEKRAFEELATRRAGDRQPVSSDPFAQITVEGLAWDPPACPLTELPDTAKLTLHLAPTLLLRVELVELQSALDGLLVRLHEVQVDSLPHISGVLELRFYTHPALPREFTGACALA